MIASKVMKRFWDKVRRGPLNECWEWQAGTTSDGYGLFWFDGKYVLAHRFAWVLAKGVISNHLCVLHTCDNPACVNVNHFVLGTIKDNNKDRDIKGRRGACGQQKGENHDQAKLTNKDIEQIKVLYQEGESQRNVARKFSISQSAVSLIVRGKRWGHI